MIKTKRAYDRPAESDGRRFLVDRLWLRGVPRDDLQVDEWLKDTAPTDGLRQWFDHDEKEWDAFRTKYSKELDRRQPAGLKTLREAVKDGDVTLVYAGRDEHHNNAVALIEILETKT